MSTNRYLNNYTHENEQQLFDELNTESIKMSGFDIWYIPRTDLSFNKSLREPDATSYKHAFKIEAYFPDHGAPSEGLFYSKFFNMHEPQGSQITISRTRFYEEIKKNNLDIKRYTRPLEGDLIYIGEGFNSFKNEWYEITKTTDPESTWQHGGRFNFKLNLKLFQYNYEKMETGIKEIDVLETQFSNENEVARAINSDYDQIVEDDNYRAFDPNNPFNFK